MVNTPLVSVIVPFYQVERYIEQCAKSLLEQTYQNIEYVFLDDGSYDKSRELLTSITAQYPERSTMIRIVGNTHIGVPMIKMRGIKEASGEYFIFVDSDDWVEKHFIDHLVKAAVSENADVVYCDCYKEYEHKPNKVVVEGDFHPSDGPNAVKALLNDDIRAYMCNKLIKRELYTRTDIIIPPCAYHEDVALLIQILFHASNCHHLREALYHYRRRRKGALTSSNRRKASAQSAINMLTIFEELPEDDGLLSLFDSSILLRAGWHSLKAISPGVLLDHPRALRELSKLSLERNAQDNMTKRLLLRIYSKTLCMFKNLRHDSFYKDLSYVRDNKVLTILSELSGQIKDNTISSKVLAETRESIVSVYNIMFDMSVPSDDATIIDNILSSYFFQSLPYDKGESLNMTKDWYSSFEDVYWMARALSNKNRRPRYLSKPRA